MLIFRPAILYDYFVEDKKWLSERHFAELFALAQSVPGPTAAQLVIALGTIYAGIFGGIVAFLAFSLLGFVLITLAGIGMSLLNFANPPLWYVGIEKGLACATIGISVPASIKLAKKMVHTRATGVITTCALAIVLVYRPIWLYPVLMIAGGIIGLLQQWISAKCCARMKQYNIEAYSDEDSLKSFVKKTYFLLRTIGKKDAPKNEEEVKEMVDEVELATKEEPHSSESSIALSPEVDIEQQQQLDKKEKEKLEDEEFLKNLNLHPYVGAIILLIHALLFASTFVIKYLDVQISVLKWFSIFYRVGSIIFGGGQVILPILISDLVETNMISQNQFFNGYSFASALPGPLMNFAAYLGAAIGGIPGAIVCWISIFLPGTLIIWGLLPFWKKYRDKPIIQQLLVGVNAVAIGLIFAALIMLYQTAVKITLDVMLVSIAMGITIYFNVSSPVMIASGALIGYCTHVFR